MIQRFYIFIFLTLTSASVVTAQDTCTIVFHGHVSDIVTGESLAGVIVHLKEKEKVTVTDSMGIFKFTGICAGTYTFHVEFLGYETLEKKVTIDRFSHPSFELTGLLGEVVIKGERKTEELNTMTRTKMEGIELDKNRGQSLGETLKDLPGLNILQTGPGVSKPVIHGLHSNRILILNNGVRQEGQQWGADHAPEVDPYIASDISVIKGAASIRYGSDAIGGVILLEPKKMPVNPGIDGEINLAGGSNNGMGAGSAMVEGAFDKRLTGLSWRVQGTYRQAGNSRAPGYYLDNTGFKEGDYSAALSYKRDSFGADLYYSHFNTTTGILTASHIGNMADLYLAFNSPAPIEKSVFSYSIGRPFQYVNHDLVKASGYIDLKNMGKIEAIYALQQDVREEYSPDIPYTNSADAVNNPQLYFRIITNAIDLAWHHPFFHGLSGSFGLTASTQGNVYRGTDFYSVIPNFRNYGAGAYLIEKWSHNNWTVEGGLRYDYRWLQVYMYNVNLQYVDPVHQYANLTTSLGATYKFNQRLSANFNYGSAWRPPGPNELYGQGVHVSAASFERGDSSLGVEKAYNFTGSLKYLVEKFSAELGIYNNIINNYIFLKPDLKPVTLISGTYPAFTYTQANVVFRGIDLDLKYNPIPQLSIFSKSTLIRAFNYSINDYLVFTPADRFENGIRYEIKQYKGLKKIYLGFSNVFVAHQGQVPANSDYVEPPPSYTLFNAEAGGFVYFGKQPVEINFSVNNIANTAYRDYLDRLRYFADEAGRNFVLRIKIPLNFAKQSNDSNSKSINNEIQ
jgi:iron complex outermembrane recepter protein